MGTDYCQAIQFFSRTRLFSSNNHDWPDFAFSFNYENAHDSLALL